MDNDNKQNDRYFTNQEEFQILKESIGEYFGLPKRSQDRKNFISQVTKKLEKIHPGRWNDKLVRVWFTNNQERLLNNNGEADDINNNNQDTSQYPDNSESPQVKTQQLPPYIDQKPPMRQAQLIKPPQQIQQSQYEQPLIQQTQYEQPPIAQPQYEQRPIQQSQYEQQPPIQQPQYEQQSVIQPQYDQQPAQQVQYDQQQYQQPPIQQQQYQQASVQQQFQQQSPYQQPPIQQQFQQSQIQPERQFQETAEEVPNREYSLPLNYYPSAEASRLNSTYFPYNSFNSNIALSDSYFNQNEPIPISQYETSNSNQMQTSSTTDSNQANAANCENQSNQDDDNNHESEDSSYNTNDNEDDLCDKLPTVPIVGSDLTGEQKDDIKFQLYHNYLPECYYYFRKLKILTNPEVRLKKQEALEDVFVDILKIFPEKLQIEQIFSKDAKTPFTLSKNAVQPSVSLTTQRYNNMPVDNDAPANSPQLVLGDPFIYYSKAFVPPPKLSSSLKAFYFGKYTEGNRIVTPISNIEAATFTPETGDSICAVFNPTLKLHQIVLGQNDAEAPTGFFQKVTSMIVHNNSVYIQGDVRVRAFNLGNYLECTDTLFIRDEPIQKSAIAIWNQNVAVGVDNTIYLYSEMLPSKTSKEDPAFRKKNESIAIENGLDPELIDWTKGRKFKGFITVDRIEKITSMITVGENLIVASENYPVIHVYGPNQKVIARLIGHTMGITSLHSHDNISFYSGSKDKTIKRWDMKNFIAENSFLMHKEEVTSMATAEYIGHQFLFTGSKDSRIFVWDVTSKRSTFQISVTDERYPMAILFSPSCTTLSIIALNKRPVEEGKDSQKNDDQIQTFTFSKE